ncbi:MAG: hypothetical protein ABI402_07930 [Ferruginibacter sp.]
METYLISNDYNGPVILIFGDTLNGIPNNNVYDFTKSNILRIQKNISDDNFINLDNINFFGIDNNNKFKIPIILNEGEILGDTTKYVFLYNSQIGDRNHKKSYQSIIISDKAHYSNSVHLENHLLDSLSR